MPMATLLAAGDHGEVTGRDGRERPDRRPRRRSPTPASTWTTSPTSCCARASTRSSSRWSKLLEGIELQARGDRSPRARRRSTPRCPTSYEPRDRARVARAAARGRRAARSGARTTRCGARAGQPEVANRLGWLTIAERCASELDDLQAFAAGVRDEGVTDVVLLGMGGSSLAPEVLPALVRRRTAGWPSLHVLDSTDAGAVRASRRRSTSTTRCSSSRRSPAGRSRRCRCFKHFWALRAGRQRVRRHHRPGLGRCERSASEHGFRRIFLNDPDIGGRYSALSYFGLVPGGADGRRRAQALLHVAGVAEHACQSLDSGDGQRRAVARPARSASWRWRGRDKLTFVVDAPLRVLRAVGRAARSPSRPASTARASCRSPTSRSATPERLRRRPRLPAPAPRRRRPTRRPTRKVAALARGRPAGDHAARSTGPPTSGGSSSSPSSRSRSSAGCWRSTRSTSPTCRRPRTRRTRVLAEGRRRTIADADRRRAARRCCAAPAPPSYLAIMGYVEPVRASSTRAVARAARGRSATRTQVGDDVRLRPALPALDRPAAQGRPADRALPAARRTTRRPTSTIPDGRLHASRRLKHAQADRRPARRCARTTCRPSASTLDGDDPAAALRSHRARTCRRAWCRSASSASARWAATWSHRIKRDSDHEVVAFDFDARGASAAPPRSGAVGAKSLRRPRQEARRRRARSGSWSRPATRPSRPSTSSPSCSTRATRSSTAATRKLDRRHGAAPRSCAKQGIHYVDVGTSRRRLGPRGRLLHDGRRPERGDQAARRRSSTCSPRRPTEEHGPGWGHMGPTGAGPLREDGPQRHRVRDDAGLRRGLRALRRVRVRARQREDRPPVDAGLGRPLVAVRAGRQRLRAGRQRPRRARAGRRRLRRGPLDGRGRDRPAASRRRSSPRRSTRASSSRGQRRLTRRRSTPRCATSSAATRCKTAGRAVTAP